VKIHGVDVRTELFQWVKCIYLEGDLEHAAGRIFEDLNKNCAKLIGRGVQEGEKTHYIACLWNQALKEKIHWYQLSTRCSGVYTVMQTRFLGK
jgi:hypothetical protein